MGYSRKQGDTYPVRAEITDKAGSVDLTGATLIRLTLSSKATRSTAAAVVASSDGASIIGETGWALFEDVDEIAALTPGIYDAEITFTVDGIISTTDTFDFAITRQLA